jgi:AmmeMemoRadiSam system protein B
LRRDLQAVETTVEGRPCIAFHDPLQLAGGSFAFDRRALVLLELLDGTNDIRDVQVALMRRQGGAIVPLEDLERFILELDRNYLLESDRFREKMDDLRGEYRRREEREPSHAGRSYSGDGGTLVRFIEETERGLPPLSPGGLPEGAVAGVVAPHIDIQVAAGVYVDLYRRLRKGAWDVVLVLGINHQGQDGLYSVSTKHYRTPLGTLRAHREFIARLAASVPPGTLAPDDFGHRMEHSVEFQALFLRYYLGGEIPVVPVLCGGIHEFLIRGTDPTADPRFEGMAAAFEGILRERGERALVVAGADLAHVGMKFGHGRPASLLLEEARRNDREILAALERTDTAAVFGNARRTMDRYNTCGLPALLLLSRLLRGCRGTLLAHETYDERATESAVTYGSMVFTVP